MMLLRALNSFDIAADPIENGIASKRVMYELTKNYYSSNSREYNSLSDEEKDIFIKEHMLEYVSSHKDKLEKMFSKKTLGAREDGKEFRKVSLFVESMRRNHIPISNANAPQNINFGIYIKIYKYLSTLQYHLVSGNTKITDWISTSKKFDRNQKFQDGQDIHKIALIYSHYEQFVDPNGVMIVDLSTQEKIKEKRFLCNKIEGYSEEELDSLAERCRHNPELFVKVNNEIIRKTKHNCRGFSYSTSAAEVCINKYIPKKYIVGVLDGLQLDLFLEGIIDYHFYFLSRKEQAKELVKFKERLLEEIKKSGDQSLLYTFDELYNKDKNIKNIGDDEDKLTHNRGLILRKARDIKSPLIIK